MKSKIVLWATNEKEEKILLAIELLAKEDKVRLYTFSEELATEEFYGVMMNTWRSDGQVAFPEDHQIIDRKLSMTDDLLPETIRVERTDIINRAKTEWHFSVLSAKMFDMYKGELEDIKDRVANLTNYDSGVWEELKGFWTKIQDQIRERNLFREQGNELRETTDGLFEQLKTLRKSLDDEFRTRSKEHMAAFSSKLVEVEEKIEKGLGLQPLFDKLKKLQQEFKDLDFTKEDRRKLWKRLDSAFKNVKDKKFGDGGGGSAENNSLSRVQRRYDGLMDAIGKMQKSIDRDRKDKEYQDRQIQNTGSQLESQLKQAKVMMIQERLDSKQVKLDDMLATKADLLKRIDVEKAKEAKRLEKQEVEAAKAEIKAKIAQDIEKAEAERNEEAEKLEKAAQKIAGSKAKKDKVNVAAEVVTPVVAITEAVVDDTVDKVKEKEPETTSDTTPETTPEKEAPAEENVSAAESAAESIVDTIENVVEKGKEMLKDVIESIEDAVEDIVDKLNDEEE